MPHPDQGTSRFALMAPLRPGTMDLIHELVAQACASEPPASMVDRIRFETAVIEVAGNIMEHSARIDPPHLEPRTFDIVMVSDPTTLSAVFRDDGRPVELDFHAISMPDEDAEAGRGLALALAAVDEVTYERVDATNTWRITCHRTA